MYISGSSMGFAPGSTAGVYVPDTVQKSTILNTAINVGLIAGTDGVGAAAKTTLTGVVDMAGATAARDAMASTVGKRVATVSAGVNTETGEVAAAACGGGRCAEAHVVDALGGNKDVVKFTKAIRPRTGNEVPVCTRCEATYGRGSFPEGTKFQTDGQ